MSQHQELEVLTLKGDLQKYLYPSYNMNHYPLYAVLQQELVEMLLDTGGRLVAYSPSVHAGKAPCVDSFREAKTAMAFSTYLQFDAHTHHTPVVLELFWTPTSRLGVIESGINITATAGMVAIIGTSVKLAIERHPREQLWNEAVGRGYCNKTGDRFEGERFAIDRQNDHHVIELYRCNETAVFYNFDGSETKPAGSEPRQPATLCLEVRRFARGMLATDNKYYMDKSDRANHLRQAHTESLIHYADLRNAGIACSTYTGEYHTEWYFATKRMEPQLLAAYDVLRQKLELVETVRNPA